MKRLVYISIALMIFSSCAPSGPKAEVVYPEQRNFKVSVFRGDQKVKDFSRSLVHRFTVKPSSLKILSLEGTTIMPFSFSTAKDSQGKAKGLKVKSKKYKASAATRRALALGLRHGDVITAVNKTHVKNSRSFKKLFQILRQEKKATLTLEREGSPHKIFYDLAG